MSTIVASRCPHRLFLAASISLSTSRSVRCSRVLYSALVFRRGCATVHISELGATNFKCAFAVISASIRYLTVHLIRLLCTVVNERFQFSPRFPTATRLTMRPPIPGLCHFDPQGLMEPGPSAESERYYFKNCMRQGLPRLSNIETPAETQNNYELKSVYKFSNRPMGQRKLSNVQIPNASNSAPVE